MNATITKARRLLKERADSLLKDVQFCVLDNVEHKNWPAPFPALLYCFSTIDLMGALFWKCSLEDKTKQEKCEKEMASGVTNKALNYMMEYMKYPEREAKLIQKVFRHKLVHWAQAQPIAAFEGRKYSWRYLHNDRSQHLRLIEDSSSGVCIFTVSIWSLAEDIVESIFGPGGYLDSISRNTEESQQLRERFNSAYTNIFENNG